MARSARPARRFLPSLRGRPLVVSVVTVEELLEGATDEDRAATAYATALRWYAECQEPRTQLLATHRVARVGDDADVCVAPLHSPSSVLEEDPHVNSEGRTLDVQIGDKAGRLPPMPYETDAYSFSVRYEAPKEPGRDTEEILRENLMVTDHDLPVDLIATPRAVIDVERQYPRPKGILWDRGDAAKLPG